MLCPCRPQLSLKTESDPVAVPVSKALAENTNLNCSSLWVSKVSLFSLLRLVIKYIQSSVSALDLGCWFPHPSETIQHSSQSRATPQPFNFWNTLFPGRNSINLSWWKSCFWSGTWFTCSFSFRLGEWQLPAGVRTFTFPLSVLKELKAPSLMIWAHGWQSVFYQQNTIPKNQSKTSWLRRKSEPRLWKSHCSSAFIDWAMALAHYFFLLSGNWCHLGYGRFSIFDLGCGTSWTHRPPPPQDFLVMDASPLLINSAPANCPPDTFPANSLSSRQVLPCLDTSMALLSLGLFF